MKWFKKEVIENIKPNSFNWVNDGNYSSEYKENITFLGIFNKSIAIKRKCKDTEQPKNTERLIIQGFTISDMQQVDEY